MSGDADEGLKSLMMFDNCPVNDQRWSLVMMVVNEDVFLLVMVHRS